MCARFHASRRRRDHKEPKLAATVESLRPYHRSRRIIITFPSRILSPLEHESKGVHHNAVDSGVSAAIRGAPMIANLLPVMRELGVTFLRSHFAKFGTLFDERGALLDENVSWIDVFLDSLISFV